MRRIVLMVVVALCPLVMVPVARANPPPPGCERVPILGLNPQIRKICDSPFAADGSWERARQFTQPEFVHSTCGDDGYMTRTGYYCPPWATYDSVPAYEGPIDTYTVTWDTIPPGEPGHIDGG